MNAERLFAHYESIADAPDAIARLRRFTLDLAVRGKLVQHDLIDGHASALLEQIAEEKTRLIHSKAIKAGNPLPAISVKEQPFDLPHGWAWTRLGQLIHLVSGQHLQPPEYSDDPKAGLPYITGPSDFGAQGLQISRFALVRKAVAKKGQLLLTVKGSGVGKTTTCDIPEVAISRQLMALTAIAWDDTFLVLITHRLAEKLQEGARSLIPGISREDIEEFVFALPPLAEQHRIVAKVDELMVLCDRLEAARTAQEATRNRLAASSLARLNTPDPETFQTDARFALNALPALTTRPDQIKQLRQTILNLAVRGKLVAQDRTDEPASMLLERIAQEKARLVKDRAIRSRDIQPPIEADQIPFETPVSWVWTRLGTLCFLITDGAHHTPKYQDEGVPFLSVKDVSSGTLDFSHTRFITETAHRELAKRCNPALGDILLTKVGTTGIAVEVGTDREFSIFVSLALLKFSGENVDRRFLCHLINSPFVKRQSADNTQGIGNKNLVLRLINQFAIPLPPLAEQHRIVAKVDALMALCDRLEASLTATAATRRRLLHALLAEALVPAAVDAREAAE